MYNFTSAQISIVAKAFCLAVKKHTSITMQDLCKTCENTETFNNFIKDNTGVFKLFENLAKITSEFRFQDLLNAIHYVSAKMSGLNFYYVISNSELNKQEVRNIIAKTYNNSSQTDLKIHFIKDEKYKYQGFSVYYDDSVMHVTLEAAKTKLKKLCS